MSITLRINSPGGVVNEAVAIHTMLTEWRAGVDVRIDGIAASAASYLATLGRQVAIAREGLVMIHEPYGVTMGDSRDHRGAAERLDRVAESLVNAYVARTGRSREEIRTIMKAETWFTAQGAIEYGLADSIIGEEAEQAKGRTPRLNLATARLKLMESDARIAAMSSRY
jgi:ATP-dependent Clp protease protease subunit